MFHRVRRIRLEPLAITLLVFVAPFALSQNPVQNSDSMPGSWVKLSVGGNSTGCPELVTRPKGRPSLIAALEIEFYMPHSVYSQFNLYSFFPDDTGIWTAGGSPINLNPNEGLTSFSYHSTLEDSSVAFMSWIETRHKYGQTPVVVSKFYAGQLYPVTQLFQVDPDKNAYAVSSLIDSEEKPVIAWSDPFTPGYNGALNEANRVTFVDGTKYQDSMIYVQRWDGTVWQTLGQPLQGARPELASTSQGALYLSYVREASNQNRRQFDIVTLYWDGNTWQPLGEPLRNGYANLPSQYAGHLEWDFFPRVSLVVDEQGNPVIAWIGEDADAPALQSQLFIRQWNGESWQALPGVPVSAPERLAKDFEMSFGNGNLLLLVSETERPEPTYLAPTFQRVVQWDGVSWKALGEELPYSLLCPSVVQNDQGEVYLAGGVRKGSPYVTGSSVVMFHFEPEE